MVWQVQGPLCLWQPPILALWPLNQQIFTSFIPSHPPHFFSFFWDRRGKSTQGFFFCQRAWAGISSETTASGLEFWFSEAPVSLSIKWVQLCPPKSLRRFLERRCLCDSSKLYRAVRGLVWSPQHLPDANWWLSGHQPQKASTLKQCSL